MKSAGSRESACYAQVKEGAEISDANSRAASIKASAADLLTRPIESAWRSRYLAGQLSSRAVRTMVRDNNQEQQSAGTMPSLTKYAGELGPVGGDADFAIRTSIPRRSPGVDTAAISAVERRGERI